MGLFDKLWSALKTDPDFQGLSDEQAEAVVDALVAVTFSDARLAPEEVRVFDQALERLPWRWAHDARSRERVISSAREKADGLADPAAAKALADSVAARLPQGAVREKVLGLCRGVAMADGTEEEGERRFLGLLAGAFGLAARN